MHSKQIKFVQLEPAAFLTDMDFFAMSAAERGVYWTIILYLYCNNGKCDFDIEGLAWLNFPQLVEFRKWLKKLFSAA